MKMVVKTGVVAPEHQSFEGKSLKCVYTYKYIDFWLLVVAWTHVALGGNRDSVYGYVFGSWASAKPWDPSQWRYIITYKWWVV